MSIEDLLSVEQRKELEALRLIALARDLLNGKHSRAAQICLDKAIEALGRACDDDVPKWSSLDTPTPS
jgi:hypothetical protein